MQETYIEQILKELTLEEKIGMIHGAVYSAPKEWSGFPSHRSICRMDRWECAQNLRTMNGGVSGRRKIM